MINLIPEKYRTDMNNLVWLHNLQEAYNALSLKYQITEIVPLCLEEFIQMSARDLVVCNITKAHTGSIDVLTYDNLELFTNVKYNNSGLSIDTTFQYEILHSYCMEDRYKGNKGFHTIKYINDKGYENYLTEHSQRYKFDKYMEYFIFKIKAKDAKKIKIDNPSLEYLKTILTEQEFQIAKHNFKRINKDGRLLEESA